MDIGPLITAARKRAGYKTAYEFAHAADLSTGHLSDILSGKHSPTIDTLERIFHAIGWEVEVIFRPARDRGSALPPEAD